MNFKKFYRKSVAVTLMISALVLPSASVLGQDATVVEKDSVSNSNQIIEETNEPIIVDEIVVTDPDNDAPITVVPTMETSLSKDVYQSYETIYVMLSAPEEYAIYYTLDGSDATDAGIKYTKPFAVEAPGAIGGEVVLHAIAIRSSNVE